MDTLNYKRITRLSAIVFVALELVLFPLIQLTPARVSEVACYLAIVFVALFAAVTSGGEKEGHLIRLGIIFTLVADYFLVLADDAQLEGVIAFIAVQLCYFAYLFKREERTKVRVVNAASRIVLSILLVIAAFVVLGEDTDALAIASVLYYGNLVANAVFAFALGKEERIFAVGLVLFGMCDLCIGLEVLCSSYLESSVMDFMYGANLNLPWVFYQPSQTLIGLRLLTMVRDDEKH